MGQSCMDCRTVISAKTRNPCTGNSGNDAIRGHLTNAKSGLVGNK